MQAYKYIIYNLTSTTYRQSSVFQVRNWDGLPEMFLHDFEVISYNKIAQNTTKSWTIGIAANAKKQIKVGNWQKRLLIEWLIEAQLPKPGCT